MKKDTKLNIKNNDKSITIDNWQKISGFEYLKFIDVTKHPIKKLSEFFKKRLKKRKMFMAVMQLRNGKYYQFTVATSEEYFIYDKGCYYIDPDMVREDTFTKLNTLFYHQECSMPFKLDFNISDLKDSLKGVDSDVEKAINPSSLKSFISSQVIEKVLKGADMIKELSQIKMMVLINMLVTIGLVGVIAKTLGWF
jgi:hypothetical protein